ncbi:MAG: cysteine desulfurase NifS [Candidatus Altiarchaeales archaeon IMC4]|nr:MAG: cysteine desulfurase NifS [Candidatus Altiarchaeales archaeon IMC4]
MKRIYLDSAATTPVAQEVLEAMLPFFSENFANASSSHSQGMAAREAVEISREKIAGKINALPHEIIFTSGGTESNNLALKGTAFSKLRGHIITTQVEHSCVLNSCGWLEKRGFDVTYLPVDKYGIVDPADVESAIQKDTFLTTIIHASNEIGTIEPIREIGEICRERGVCFHTDACQGFTKVPIDVEKDNIDLMTINAHKIYGPNGVGALYVRSGTEIEPLQHGGGHEFGLRSGTENVAGIVGFAKASEVITDEDIRRMTTLRDRLITRLSEIPDSGLNGHPTKRLCSNVNFYFKDIAGEALLARLDSKGIAASTGSACSSGSGQPSHVLCAIGLKPEEVSGSLRLTLGIYNTREEIDRAAETIREEVKLMRKQGCLCEK